mgnify:CR=1 FL=1|tara:strand:+ start:1115 stop:1831 length:717 start_codon:yes stop_codon:yes gene_type:complete
MIITVHYAKDIINTIDMVSSLTEDDLVLISLDNVVIEPTQMYGSPEHYVELKRILAESDASSIFRKAQESTNVRLPEDDIKDVISSLTQRGIMVMGITSRRHYALKDITTKQLQKLDVNFHHTNLHVSDGEVHLENNILYSNGTSRKAQCAELLSKKTEFIPSRIIFIAASQTAIEEFGSSIDNSKVEYLGINYDHLNWKIKNFDLSVADLQREHHEERDVILSDRDAMRLLNQRFSL